MADEQCDVCECIYQKLAVQRFLQFVRQTQNYCTDTDCLNTPQLPGSNNVLQLPDYCSLALLLGFIGLLYIYRPSSLRQRRQYDSTKDQENEPGSGGDPPVPPAVN